MHLLIQSEESHVIVESDGAIGLVLGDPFHFAVNVGGLVSGGPVMFQESDGDMLLVESEG